MTAENTARKFCAELRKMGFSDDPESKTAIIPADAMINASQRMKWAKITHIRYVGDCGYLVDFGFLEIVGDGEYRLTGEDVEETT